MMTKPIDNQPGGKAEIEHDACVIPIHPVKMRRKYGARHVLLEEMLRDRRMTDADLARELKVQQSTVHSWITGQFQPRVQYIHAMCKILDCSSDELLGIDYVKHPHLNRALSKDLYKSVTKSGEYDAITIHRMATKFRELTGGRLGSFERWLRAIAEAVYRVEVATRHPVKKTDHGDNSQQLRLF